MVRSLGSFAVERCCFSDEPSSQGDDALDLNEGTERQSRDLHRRASRFVFTKGLGVEGIHYREIRHVGEKDRRFGDLRKICALTLQDSLNVGKNLTRLFRDPSGYELHGGGIERDLA